MGHALVLPEPYDAVGVIRFLVAHAVEGVESGEVGPHRLRYARTLALPGGPGAVELTADRGARVGGWRMRLELELTAPEDAAAATAVARRLLDLDTDLDTDPALVDTALARDAVLAPLVAATPGIRVPGSADAGETLLRTIVGQQISVLAARQHLARLAVALGTPVRSRFAGLHVLFPGADRIAALPTPSADHPGYAERTLRLPARTVRTVVDTARALADGELDLADGSGDDLVARLVRRPGIGPWTAAYTAMRVRGDPDAWLLGDVAVLAGAVAVGAAPAGARGAAAQRALEGRAAEWSPWRSYATVHLWNAVTGWSADPGGDPRFRG